VLIPELEDTLNRAGCDHAQLTAAARCSEERGIERTSVI